MNINGWKSYLAATGLLGLALYQATTGDFGHATQNLLAALAVFGVRQAVGRTEEHLVQLKRKAGLGQD